ncbi:MAG: glycosylase [Flammeovirgaceae bacterium]|nr:MAG: glycosylase [Flammeovirgaceae bacterium]
MFRWIKLGRIFNPQEVKGINWLAEFAQAPSVLLFDDFVRVYFSCRPPADELGRYVSYTAYVDLKRTDFFKVVELAKQPVMSLGERGTFDEFGTYPFSVIRNADELWGYYGGWTRCESVPFNVAIGVACSRDNGKTFIRLGKGPVLSYSPDEPFILSGPKIRRFNNYFVLYYIAGKKWISTENRPEPVYRIRMAISDDGINWKKQNRDLIDVRLEENECQASPDVFYSNGRYHMFFCYRYSLNYRSKTGGYRIGYAVSDDGFNWTRDDNKAGIAVSEEGWDSEMISYPHVFELDGSIYMLYLGNQVGRYGFGLALLDGCL